jgi:hypothetical protein
MCKVIINAVFMYFDMSMKSAQLVFKQLFNTLFPHEILWPAVTKYSHLPHA